MARQSQTSRKRQTLRQSQTETNSEKEMHDRVWDKIFPTKEWVSIATDMGLVPILVGHDVSRVYNNTFQPPAYFNYLSEILNICLVTGDFSGELAKQKDLLIKCLGIDNKKRRLYDSVGTVILEDVGISLNIKNALGPREIIPTDVKDLFSKDSVSSAALFWGDYSLRTIGPDDVVGVGGRASSLDSIAHCCAIELTHPNMKQISGTRWNQIFQNPRHLEPMGGTEKFIEGWEYRW
ncbi:hypothetical protein V501_02385 [Pseudogymnoascus sp. VKM F-4519 (FW-2642)]|nr:hypothetical protein V501_02385 [Pseudogymnoascus sp. VKM F-4519 (FW-2642)]